MRYATLCLLSLLYADSIQASSTSSTQSPNVQSPVVINMPEQKAPVVHMTCNPNIAVHVSSDAKAQTVMHNTNTQTYSENFSKIYEEMMNKFKIMNEEKYNYKWHVIAGCLISAYIFAYYHVYNAYRLLENKYAWCRWKEVIPLHQLCVGDCDDVIGQLMFDIHKKYYQKRVAVVESINDQLFIQDVLQERQALQWYLSMQVWINRVYASRFFPLKYTKEIIEEYIARLDLITDLFLQKCCQQELGYKINPNNNKPQN